MRGWRKNKLKIKALVGTAVVKGRCESKNLRYLSEDFRLSVTRNAYEFFSDHRKATDYS